MWSAICWRGTWLKNCYTIIFKKGVTRDILGLKGSLMSEDKDKYVTKSLLKSKYCLSEAWIQKLGPADRETTNPHYKSGPSMLLYSEERVIDFIVQNADEYSRWIEKRQRLSDAQKELQRQHREETLQWARTVEITFETLPANLIDAAIQYYATRALDRDDYDHDPKTTNYRGVLAYLRHEKTNYDSLCGQLIAKTGTAAAYQILANRVADACALKVFEKCGMAFFEERICDLESKCPTLIGKVHAMVQDPSEFTAFSQELDDNMLSGPRGGKEARDIAKALLAISAAKGETLSL